MSLEIEQVTIKKATRTGDGGGGKNKTLATVAAGVDCTFNYYQRNSTFSVEEAGPDGSGPGQTSRSEGFFTFEIDPLPECEKSYIIVRPDGENWKVISRPRIYDGPMMQADCELI